MSKRPGILITKPIGILNKDINVDWRSFFTGIIKVGANAVTTNWGNLPENIVDIGAAVGLAKEPGELAWVLIFQSLIKAMASLVEDNQDLIQQANKHREVNLDDLKIISEHRLSQSLEKLDQEEITIYQDFFENPQDLSIIAAIKTPFAEWLQSLNLNQAQAEAISQRLPIQFISALHEEWANNSDKYARLQAELDTPFIKAVEREAKRELSWRRYFAWLQNQINQRMFDEVFTLQQVYISLRAYYEERNDEKREQKTQKIVVDLDTELQTWLDEANPKDAIRVISGSPGSGKSSFTKIFAAKQAKTWLNKETNQPKVHVLFIPLHLFNPEGDLVTEIGKFINSMRRDTPLPSNPLEQDNFVPRLLIIFDGLDELSMQGKLGADVAQKFVSEVRGEVNRANTSQTHLQVLISGRELVVQNNSSEFRKEKQILYILPYLIEEKQKTDYVDEKKLLDKDQRHLWWRSYGSASNRGYDGLPTELDKGQLREITAQPLLNYLVALSYDQNKSFLSENSNLNDIYASLLTRVYRRVWADDNPHIRGVEEEDFIRILEGIAIAAWHGGDGRTTTVKKIESLCEQEILKRVLDVFKVSDSKAGITRLLTAFYFRKSGYKQDEETFEFTHKSFGEYLTARRIVWEVKRLYEMQELSKKNSYITWSEKDALKQWAELCGSTAMDNYLFQFVINEIRLQQDKDKVDVGKWQEMLCHLIGFMLRHGMPMELLPEIKSFHQANQQARNAEEALLVVLNACARVTQRISKIEWPDLETSEASEKPKASNTFGAWISRLHGQRVSWRADVLCLDCLSFLNLQNCILMTKDFHSANLERANFREANLIRADLRLAHLREVNLEGAELGLADLRWADIREVNLEGADLETADLRWANLAGANLARANLAEVNLAGANLEGANLQRANLQRAIVEWPKLLPANFEDEDITDFDDDDSNSNE
ncbi:pentapeptide repeat-containing protein [Nostoc sp. HK-01]|nr:pentapeptide repeat-containing protein [Nostoc sp. HK-01]